MNTLLMSWTNVPVGVESIASYSRSKSLATIAVACADWSWILSLSTSNAVLKGVRRPTTFRAPIAASTPSSRRDMSSTSRWPAIAQHATKKLSAVASRTTWSSTYLSGRNESRGRDEKTPERDVQRNAG